MKENKPLMNLLKYGCPLSLRGCWNEPRNGAVLRFVRPEASRAPPRRFSSLGDAFEPEAKGRNHSRGMTPAEIWSGCRKRVCAA